MNSLQDLLGRINCDITSWDEKVEAADRIAGNFGQCAVTGLVSILQSDNSEARNAAALALREINDDRAVASLIKAIQNPNNLSNRSTMVYALEKLDCSENFVEIFSLVISSRVEVRIAAANIFFSQGFMVDDSDIEKAKKQLETTCIDDVEYLQAVRKRLAEFE